MKIYKAYGFPISSVFELPELPPYTGAGSCISICDAEIVLPLSLKAQNCYRKGVQAFFHGDENLAFLHWPGIADFKAEKGTTLYADVKTENDDIFRMFLLSEALGLVLFQRGCFLLHASAVKVGDQAVVLMGLPGSGKSTTAAAFAMSGCPILADDLVALSFDPENRPFVVPAFPQIKIWQSAVKGLGLESAPIDPLYPGSEKFKLVAKSDFPDQPVKLGHIIVLDAKGMPASMIEIPSHEAFLQLTRYFALPPSLLQGAALQRHFNQASAITMHSKMWNLGRPAGFGELKNFVERQLTDFTAEYSSQQPTRP